MSVALYPVDSWSGEDRDVIRTWIRPSSVNVVSHIERIGTYVSPDCEPHKFSVMVGNLAVEFQFLSRRETEAARDGLLRAAGV